MNNIIEVENLSKEYKKLKAIDNLSFIYHLKYMKEKF